MKKTMIFIGCTILLIMISVILIFNFSNNTNILEDKSIEIKQEISNNFIQLNVSQFKEKLSNPDIILIDVRTPKELTIYGKIQNMQKLIDINDGDFYSKILKLNKTNKYLIYCWHGRRSLVARNYMEEQGFLYVNDLEGGIDAWVNLGENVLK